MFGFFKRLFGTQAQRAIKKLQVRVEEINTIYETLSSLTHDQLRGETDKLRKILTVNLEPFDDKIEDHKEAKKDSYDHKAYYDTLKRLHEEHHKKTQEILDALLPRAYAIVKETARRFKNNPQLTVTATDYDRQLAESKPNITIEGGNAHWQNQWEVGGQMITWALLHYDVQLMGGIVLHQGKIAEMGTGEGKTLVATLPAYLNALTRKGVHIVTVNNYLAQRDADWMGPILQFHGITLSTIGNIPVQSAALKEAYKADVIYGTNSAFGFDYLYDNIAKHASRQVQRPYYYALVDEIDSILIDDARTPLIISGKSKTDQRKLYVKCKPYVKQIYQVQRNMVTQYLKEAKEKIKAGDEEEGGLALLRASRALPFYPPLTTYLWKEKGIAQLLARTKDFYHEENSRRMGFVDEPLYFIINERTKGINITEKGTEYLATKINDKNLFILPDIPATMAEIEADKALSPEKKLQKRQKVLDEFNDKSTNIHVIKQLLKAYAIFISNQHYTIQNNTIRLIDQKTGRPLPSRRYSDGLQEAIEAKEGVPIQRPSQTLATITVTNQFRRYPKLAGMTGTASTEAVEMKEIYNLDVVAIPPNKPIIREDKPDLLYKTTEEKMNAIVNLVNKIHASHRPVLLIAPSVEVSEQLRDRLKIPTEKVLNAKNHHLEANIIAQAGQIAASTIATQMAGRGTDIKVSPEAQKAGGLHVVIAEKHPTRRVDNQARGRTGRQGERGTTQAFLSLEDSIVSHWKQASFGKQVDAQWGDEGEPLSGKIINHIITSVQKAKEQNSYASRKRSITYDDILEKQRETIYRRRNNALRHDRLKPDIDNATFNSLHHLTDQDQLQEGESHHLPILQLFGGHGKEIEAIFEEKSATLVQSLYEFAKKVEHEKIKALTEALGASERIQNAPSFLFPVEVAKSIIPIIVDGERFRDAEKREAYLASLLYSIFTLIVIDDLWVEYLQKVDTLQDTVQNARHENKDPLLIFKFEALKLFQQLFHRINETITEYVLTYIPRTDKVILQRLQTEEEEEVHTNRDEGEVNTKPIVAKKIPNRNQRVTVRYEDGTTKENVKYKVIEGDVLEGKCTLV